MPLYVNALYDVNALYEIVLNSNWQIDKLGKINKTRESQQSGLEKWLKICCM